MENFLFEQAINSLHENGSISFGKLKEMLSNVSNFALEKQELPKGKKILLSFSIKNGKIIVAENKSDVKNNGYTITEYLKKCDDMKEEIEHSLNNLEKNINSLNAEDQESIFGTDNNVYYSVELLRKPEKCFNYNTKHFLMLPDGHGEYDSSGKQIVFEVTRQKTKLESLLEKWQNKLKQENFNTQNISIRKIKELNEKEYYNYAANKLDNILSSTNSHINNSSYNLNDSSTIDDFMLSRVYILLNGLLDKSKVGDCDPIAKMNIAKKLLGIRGIGINDITNKLHDDQKKFVKENILNNNSKKEILKTAIQPVENIIINYCLETLKSAQALLSLDSSTQNNRIIKQIGNSIKLINASNSIIPLKNELKNLRFVDKYINKPKNNLFYDGEIYKFSDGFQPINELLKLFKPINNNNINKKVIDELNMNYLIQETIKKSGDKYCLLSKKTHKNLGCYRSKKSAKKREKQVQYFKHLKETIDTETV